MLYRYLCVLLFLILTPVASAQTDLTISATAEDASGEAGGRLTLDYTVTNSGDFEIEDVSVGFYFSTNQTLSDNDVLSEREEVDVDENESESDNEQIDIPGSLDSGDYFVLVVIDDLEQVTETDETNNTAAIPFTVKGGGGGGGQADLVVTSASAEPQSADAGAEISVSYTLANQGSEQAGESQLGFYFSTNATLSSNDVLATREDVDAVDANDSTDDDAELTVPNSLAPGDYFIIVAADDRNTVTESTENNNTLAIPFTVTGSGGGGGGEADLEVTDASVTPSSAEAGAEVTVSYTLANTGTEQAGASQLAFYFSTDASLSASDVLAESIEVDEVDAGDVGDNDESITVPSTLAPGDYFLIVAADIGNDVSESGENNNTFAISFTVTETTASEGDASPDVLYVDAPAPNPAAESTTLRYTLGEAGPVRLAVYDLLGRRVAVLVDATQAAGAHRATWAVQDDLAASVYVLRLEAAGTVQTRRVTVTR